MISKKLSMKLKKHVNSKSKIFQVKIWNILVFKLLSLFRKITGYFEETWEEYNCLNKILEIS